MMAAYNAWANGEVFAAASGLSDAQYRQDCGAAFHSVHGTLNHMFVADVIWMSRFRGEPAPPWAQDHIPSPLFAELRARRKAMDHDIIGYVGTLTPKDLAETITFKMMVRPVEMTISRAQALAHAFNHQTHHRGQCHALLTRLTGDAPELDLLFCQHALTAP